MVIAGIGAVQALGPVATRLEEPSAFKRAPANGLLVPFLELGIPEDRTKRYSDSLLEGGVLVLASVPHQLASAVSALMRRPDLSATANKASLRVTSIGRIPVAEVIDFLRAFERAYNSILYFAQLTGESHEV
jgi:hypothetical protein